MKSKSLKARFAPPVSFAVSPTSGQPFRAHLNTEFDRIQFRMLHAFLSQTTQPDRLLTIRHAVRDAAALAASTGYPTLMFPVLVEERVAAACDYLETQARIRTETKSLSRQVA